jgi:general stress protein 26
MAANSTDDLQAVARLLATLDICTMATRAEDGAVHGRPMSNNGEVEYDGDSWFFSFDDTDKVRQIEAEPRVQLGFIDSPNQVWINVEGEATIVRDDVERKKALWLPDLERWFEQGPEDPNLVLIKVRARHIDAWSKDGEHTFDLPH